MASAALIASLAFVATIASLRQGSVTGRKAVRVHAELGGQLLNPLFSAGQALCQEPLLPLDGILQDREHVVWLRGLEFDLLRCVLRLQEDRRPWGVEVCCCWEWLRPI